MLWPITDFAPRGAAKELLAELDSTLQEIELNSPFPERVNQRFREDLLFDRIHSSAVTEGNRLSRRETIAVLSLGVLDAGARKDELEVFGLGQAMSFLDECLRDGVNLSESVIRHMHSLVTGGMPQADPGSYRLDDVRIAGSSTVVPAPGDIPDFMHELVERIRSQIDEDNPVVVGAWAHWALTRIHPFRDGNGRVARLLQDYVLIRGGHFPAPLFPEDRSGMYYESLEQADDGRPDALVELLARNELRVADGFLAVIREEAQRVAWIGIITRSARERIEDSENTAFLSWQRRVNDILIELKELGARINEGVPGLTITIREFQGVGLEKYRELRRRGRASKTWVASVEANCPGGQLRLVFWIAMHHSRPRDPENLSVADPVILVSMEEQSTDGSAYYRILDELAESHVTLRELVVQDEGLMRRRAHPVSLEDEWDERVTAGLVVREFYEGVLRKLQLA